MTAEAPDAAQAVGPLQAMGSVCFTAFFLLWTFVYGIFFSIACLLLPFRGRFELARVWARVILTVLRWTCRLDYRVEGRENIPSGNHIALIKHSSSWETVAQALLLPPHVWVLKRELTWIPFVGWGIKLLRAIAIDRGSGGAAVRGVLEQGKARLAEGEWIVIFPEGTRMPFGETRKCCLVVPIAHDAGYYWPRRGLIKRPGTIHVLIGPPITAAGRNPRDINAEAQAWIEAHSGRGGTAGGTAA
jgi:1-acyl-sn-glycerol-3-phosphate acyltransferase